MASQYMSFAVRGVGGGRGPTVRPSVTITPSHAAVLQAYADMASKRKKKKKEEDEDQWRT